MGRIFLRFLLLFIPLHTYAAEITACSTYTPSGSNACNSEAGCYWETSTEKCKACDTGSDTSPAHYGPGCNINNVCDSDFPYGYQHTINGSTGARGARTKYECYKELDGGTGNGHGEQCTEHDGSAVTCRQYYRDASTPSYYVKENVIINSQQSYYYIVCEDDDHNSPDLIETVGYRGEDTTCTDLYEANSPLYQYYCAEAYSAPASITNPHTVMRYHIETNGKCYSNALTCGKFGATGGCDSANTNDISFSGYLRWNWNNKQWRQDTNDTAFACKCTKNNIDIAVSGNNYTCTGNASYRANGTMFGLNIVDGTRVEYNNYPDEYSCESCKAGYVGFYKLNTNQSDTKKTCKKAAQGCYSYGCPYNISDNEQVNCTNGVFQSSSPSCLNVSDDVKKFYKPCYAGMTTFAFDLDSGLDLTQPTDGAFSPRQCHYTNDTKFCDAYGCTSMEQLLQNTGTSQDDWTWYMQQ